MYDIMSSPEDYYFVQFYLSDDGYVNPVSVLPFQMSTSVRYPDQHFASPKASKFGIYKYPTATHWGVIWHDPNSDEIAMLHQGLISTLTNKKRAIPFYETNYYLVLRSATKYMSVMVARSIDPIRPLSTVTIKDNS